MKKVMLGGVLVLASFSATADKDKTVTGRIYSYCNAASSKESDKQQCILTLKKLTQMAYEIGYTDSLCAKKENKQKEGCIRLKNDKDRMEDIKHFNSY